MIVFAGLGISPQDDFYPPVQGFSQLAKGAQENCNFLLGPFITVSGLSANTIYQFRVQAYASGSTSPFSAATSARTLANAATPTVYEGFDYFSDPNSVDDLENQNGGIGFSDA